MGNDHITRPKSFDENIIHQQGYLQTYHKDRRRRETFPLGRNTTVNIGVKIIQSYENGRLGDYYVMQENGQKLFLTKNRVPFEDASTRIKYGVGWGSGPAIQISGRPDNVKYKMYAATETSTGSVFKPFEIKSVADMRRVTLLGHANNNVAENAGFFGDASVSGPFEERPRNWWSTAADLGRSVVIGAEKTILPATEVVLDLFTEGMGGQVLEMVAGEEIQGALDNLIKFEDDTRSLKTNNDIFKTVTDPRLDDELYRQSRMGDDMLADTGDFELRQALFRPVRSNTEKLKKLRSLVDHSQRIHVHSIASNIQHTMDKLQDYVNPVEMEDVRQQLNRSRSVVDKTRILNGLGRKIINNHQERLKSAEKQEDSSTPEQKPVEKVRHSNHPPVYS